MLLAEQCWTNVEMSHILYRSFFDCFQLKTCRKLIKNTNFRVNLVMITEKLYWFMEWIRRICGEI